MQERTDSPLSGVSARQSWQPPAVSRAESFISGILGHTEPMRQRAARLLAWHESFTRRVQPWSGWSPLPLEFGSQEPHGEPVYPGRTSPRVSGVSLPGALSPAVHTQQSTSKPKARGEAAANRPAIELAILRRADPAEAGPRGEAISRAPGWQPPAASERLWTHPLSWPIGRERQVSNDQSGGWPLLPRDQALWRPRLSARPAELGPRLITGVAALARQEVRGGFPKTQPTIPGLTETEQTRAATTIPAATRPTTEATITPSSGGVITRIAAPVPPAPRGPVEGSRPKAGGAIEELIERTVLPVSLPGFELRMVPPEQWASAGSRPPADQAGGSQPGAGPATSPPAAPASPPAPPLDLNAVADQVYQKLIRRQQLERERRGLY